MGSLPTPLDPKAEWKKTVLARDGCVKGSVYPVMVLVVVGCTSKTVGNVYDTLAIVEHTF